MSRQLGTVPWHAMPCQSDADPGAMGWDDCPEDEDEDEDEEEDKGHE